MRSLQSAVKSAWRTADECSQALSDFTSTPPRTRNTTPTSFLSPALTSPDTLVLSGGDGTSDKPIPRRIHPRVAIRESGSHAFTVVPLRDSQTFLDSPPSTRSSTSSSYLSYGTATTTTTATTMNTTNKTAALGTSERISLSPSLSPSRSRDDDMISPLTLDASPTLPTAAIQDARARSLSPAKSRASSLRQETPLANLSSSAVPAIQLHPARGISKDLASRLEDLENAVRSGRVPESADRAALLKVPSTKRRAVHNIPPTQYLHSERELTWSDRTLATSSPPPTSSPVRIHKHVSSPPSPGHGPSNSGPDPNTNHLLPSRMIQCASISTSFLSSAHGSGKVELISLEEARARAAAEREAWTPSPSPTLSISGSEYGGVSSADDERKYDKDQRKSTRNKLRKSFNPRGLIKRHSEKALVLRDRAEATAPPLPSRPPPSASLPKLGNLRRQQSAAEYSRQPTIPGPLQAPKHTLQPRPTFNQLEEILTSSKSGRTTPSTHRSVLAMNAEPILRSAPPALGIDHERVRTRYPLENVDPNVGRPAPPAPTTVKPIPQFDLSPIVPRSPQKHRSPPLLTPTVTQSFSTLSISLGGSEYATRPISFSSQKSGKPSHSSQPLEASSSRRFVLGTPGESSLVRSRTLGKLDTKAVGRFDVRVLVDGTVCPPIVSELLAEVDMAIREWSSLGLP